MLKQVLLATTTAAASCGSIGGTTTTIRRRTKSMKSTSTLQRLLSTTSMVNLRPLLPVMARRLLRPLIPTTSPAFHAKLDLSPFCRQTFFKRFAGSMSSAGFIRTPLYARPEVEREIYYKLSDTLPPGLMARRLLRAVVPAISPTFPATSKVFQRFARCVGSSDIASHIGGFTRTPLYDRPEIPSDNKMYENLSEIHPDGRPILELRLMNHKPKRAFPNKIFIGKGVWAGFIVKDIVYSIYRRSDDSDTALAIAKNELKCLSRQDFQNFKTVWLAKNRQYIKEWSNQAVRHSYFTKSSRIANYMYLTGHLMLKFLGGGSTDINTILRDLGIIPGYFYEARYMMEAVSERARAQVYLVAQKEEEDGIPSLHYICVATDKVGNVIPHPTARLVQSGMILFPRL